MPNIPLNIVADTRKATKSLTRFGKSASASAKSIERSFSALKLVAGAAVGFIAGRQIIRGINAITEAAAVQESAIQELNTALQLSGQFSEKTSRSMQQFASSLQQTTRFGDEVILQNAALIQNLGKLDEDGLKQATKAAIELSAALKIDLTTASQLVGRAAQGEIGTFSRYGIQIEKGATAAETFANVLEKVNKGFSGAAAAQVETYAGATDQLANAFGDTQEELGFIITKNPAVVRAIKALTGLFTELNGWLQDNQKSVNALVVSFVQWGLEAIPDVIDAIATLIKGLAKVKQGFDTGVDAVAGFVFKVSGFLDDGVDGWKKAAAEAELASKELTDQSGQGLEDLANRLRDGSQAARKFLQPVISSFNELGAAAQSASEKVDISGRGKGEDGDVLKDAEALGKSFGDPINKAVGIVQGLIDFIPKLLQSVTKIFTSLTDLPGQIVKNLGGLFDSIVGFAENFGKNLLNGLGDVLESTVDFLATSLPDALISAAESIPEALIGFIQRLPEIFTKLGGALVKLFIRLPIVFATELIKQAPAIVVAFLTALPEIITGFVQGLTEALAELDFAQLIISLIEAIPRIVDALVNQFIFGGGLERLVVGLIEAAPRIAWALAEFFLRALAESAGAIGTAIAVGFKDALAGLGEALGGIFSASIELPEFEPPAWLEQLEVPTPEWLELLEIPTPAWIERLENIGKNVGGGLGDLLGFQTGGIVPETGPIRAHEGELVTPPRTTGELFDLIGILKDRLEGDRPQSQTMTTEDGRPLVVNVQIGEQELANTILNLNRQGFRTS